MIKKNLGAVTAYAIAVKNGFVGTESEWLASLKGNSGQDYVLTDADKKEIAQSIPAVIYTEQTLTKEQKTQARDNIGAVSMTDIGITVLSSSDFVNGVQTVGTGIVDSDYWITLATPVPVKIGDKIDIKPNGMKVALHIESVDNFADVVQHLKQQYNITTDTVYISEYDGYCFISAQHPAGQKITPENYVCDVTIGKSLIEKVEDNTEKIIDIEDATKCVTKLNGKKIVNFGDSIFGKYRDTSDDDKSISTMISEQTGATCYNAGFGGCLMTSVSSIWGAFSMHTLADSVNSGSWTVQEEALTNGSGTLPAYFSETVTMLKGIDWNTVDIITIGYGVNDYTSNRFIEETDFTFANEYDYYKGALRYSIKQILNAYPHIKIAIITPLWKWNMKNDGSFDYSSDDVEKSQNTRGYALVDYVDACMDVARELHTICVDNYYSLGINKYNYLNYFNSNDGTHPNKNGRQLCANNIVAQIISDTSAAPIISLGDVDKIVEERVVQTSGSSETEVMSQKAVTEEFNALDGRIRFYSSDFVNGYFSVGTGVVTGDNNANYGIMNTVGKPVNKGNKIKINPNGHNVHLMIDNVSDPSAIISHLVNLWNIKEETEIISEYDGYVFVEVRKTDGTKISPNASFEVVIGESKHDVLEKKLTNLEEKVESRCLFASPKHKPFTRIINDCQTASDWTITNNDSTLASVDTTNFILGSQSLRCDKQMRCKKHTYDLLNNDLVVKFRINSIATGASLQVRIGDLGDGGLLVYEIARGSTWTTPIGWQEVVIPYTGYSYGNTNLNFDAIKDIYVMSSAGAVDWNLQYIGLRPKALKNGIVTFTFDDGYKSQYTGIKLLAEKGITGTIFHITPAGAEGLTTLELQELVNRYGADIEVHGGTAFITDTVPESERGGFEAAWTEESLKTYWENMQSYLKDNGLGEGKHMAYPNGMFPDRVVQLAKGYFDSCRTIIPFIPLESYPPDDRYRIRAVSGVGAGGVTVDKVKDYIDRAVTSGAWLILVFHKIGNGGTDSMWCTETDLKAIADYAINSGAYIMNYAEVFDSGVVM